MNVHLEPLSDLLPLAVALWGSFARLFVVLSPPGPLFLACFGPCFPCPLFGFWSFPWFLSCCGSSVSFLSVCVSACCFAVVFTLAFVCRLWCCGASLFAVFVVLCLAPLPRWLLSPSPRLRLFPCGVLVQLLCWSLPLGIWLLHATARLPSPSVRRCPTSVVR